MVEEGETGMTILDLCREKMFWILLLMMVCAGASEQAVSQWASTFAEKGLGVSKAIGDLAGPMAFAILMGSARAFYGKFGDRIDLDKFMIGSGLLCIGSYLLISLSPLPQLSLLGCAICGLRSVRRNYVAGQFQQGICRHAKRRNRYVCIVSPRR